VPDYTKAFNVFRPAAEQGHARSQYKLGLMYANGYRVAQDHVEAVKWYRLAAAQGERDAQFKLGVMYSNGQGVVQDNVRAHSWFNLAAEAGDPEAPKNRDIVAKRMTKEQLAEAVSLARKCLISNFKDCD
jgi:uncharacterized protein